MAALCWLQCKPLIQPHVWWGGAIVHLAIGLTFFGPFVVRLKCSVEAVVHPPCNMHTSTSARIPWYALLRGGHPQELPRFESSTPYRRMLFLVNSTLQPSAHCTLHTAWLMMRGYEHTQGLSPPCILHLT